MDARVAALIEQARAGAVTPGPGMPDREKVAQLAEEFESMFILQMLRQMREAMTDQGADNEDGEDLGLGKDVMTDTVDIEVARHVARTGGLGFRKVLLEGFERQLAGDDTRGVEAPTAAGAVSGARVGPVRENAAVSAPVASPAMAPTSGTGPAEPGHDAALLDGTVTSAFGWRTDPFHGRAKFHAGVDLKAAYGREVPAVSDGRVAFAGEQGAYGLTVVVDHGGGLMTRYAHLSSLGVQSGDTLAAGTIVGRVGQSGRATGPHLHFEVLQQGRRVDPARAAEEFQAAGLKLVALDVD